MEKLCIKCSNPGKFMTRKVIQIVKGEPREYVSERNKCNKCLYQEQKEREILKIEL